MDDSAKSTVLRDLCVAAIHFNVELHANTLPPPDCLPPCLPPPRELLMQVMLFRSQESWKWCSKGLTCEHDGKGGDASGGV